MEANVYKGHILCQIFPQIKGSYFGVVFTPKETLVCYANEYHELKKSLSLAVQEVCDYIDGKISEKEFEKALHQRERIMREIIAKYGIPLYTDLYYCLTQYFEIIQEGYRPFEHLFCTSSNMSERDEPYRYGYQEKLESNMLENCTPVMWDSVEFAFIPREAFSGTPSYPGEECARICGELNKIIKLCSFEPKAGDVYYHPVTFVRGKFIVMDNQAAFDECPYPACADRDSCQKVCDMMNRVLDNK